LVVVDCGAVSAAWVTDDLDDASVGVVLAAVSADRGLTGVDSRVVLATI
jgi:hypothetical protein